MEIIQHTDLIRICAKNKAEATNSIKEFLECYNKKNIEIISITGTNGYYEVYASYTDQYDDCPMYSENDYKEEELVLSKKIQNS